MDKMEEVIELDKNGKQVNTKVLDKKDKKPLIITKDKYGNVKVRKRRAADEMSQRSYKSAYSYRSEAQKRPKETNEDTLMQFADT